MLCGSAFVEHREEPSLAKSGPSPGARLEVSTAKRSGVEPAQAVALARRVEPTDSGPAIAGELQQELPAMTAMREVPDVSWNVVPDGRGACSCLQQAIPAMKMDFSKPPKDPNLCWPSIVMRLTRLDAKGHSFLCDSLSKFRGATVQRVVHGGEDFVDRDLPVAVHIARCAGRGRSAP